MIRERNAHLNNYIAPFFNSKPPLFHFQKSECSIETFFNLNFVEWQLDEDWHAIKKQRILLNLSKYGDEACQSVFCISK